MTQTTSATTTSSKGTTTSSTHRSATSSGVSASTPSAQHSALTTSTSSLLSVLQRHRCHSQRKLPHHRHRGALQHHQRDSRGIVHRCHQERESYNANGEATKENNDFFDDIGNSRWCDGQSTITPRGRVKYNLIEMRNSAGSSVTKKR